MKKSIVTDNKEEKIQKKESILAEKLYASETRYRRLFESAKDGILILDAETGKIVDVNPFLIELLGYSKEAFLEKEIWEIGFFKDIIANQGKFLELQQQEYVRYDNLPLETSSGRKINVEFVSNVYLVNNKKVIQCNIRDITERMLVKNALIYSEANLRMLVQTIPDLIWTKDVSGKFLSCNTMFERFFGAKEVDIIGKTDYDFVDRELADFFRENDRKAMEAGKPTSNEEWITFSDDGHRAYLETIKAPMYDAQNKLIGVLGIGRDITDRKSAEQKVKESEKRFKAIFSQAPIGIALLDLQGQLILANSPLSEIVGYTRDELSKKKFIDFTYPEDIDKDLEQFNDLINGKTSLYSMEKRYVHKNGHLVWANLFVTILSDENGNFQEILGMVEDISERKKIEKALQESLERYKKLTLISPVGIFHTDENGITTFVNPTWCQISGLSFEDALGDGWLNAVHPDDKEKLIKGWNDATQNQQTSFSDYRFVRPDGSIAWVMGQAIPDTNAEGIIVGYIGTITDITERKQAELKLIKAKEKAEKNERSIREQKEEIELNNNRLESLLKVSQFSPVSIQELLDFALNETISLTNSKIGYIYFYNESTQQFILNTWSKEVMNECQVKNKHTIYDLDKTGCWGEAVRQRKPIVINDYNKENIFKKGTPEGHVKLNKFLTIPVFFENKIVAVAGVANKSSDYDNTDIRQLTLMMDNVWKYSERITLIENLKLAKEKAEESDQLKTSFLHNISHEIRTPMNAIIGFSRYINDPDLEPEKRKRFTNVIIQSSDQLLAIIDDIISIASIEAGQEKIQENEININTLCKLVKEQFSIKSNEKNVMLILKTNLTDDEATIITDATKLTQIISNLIGNSLKFTFQGFINFGYKIKENQLEFYVEDSGIGIPADMQEIIFDRFRQIETTDQRNFGGSGLGLSISKAFVEILGGKMWLTSELGKGSVFYFTIPYKNANTKKLTDISSIKGLILNLKTKTLLIAEDEESNFILLEEMLLDSGINIIRAINGIEAVDLCKSNPHIDLVLMDLKMPKMDGFEATRRISEFRPELPIIAQTAYSAAADKNKALACGCSDYLSKPIKKELLLSKINEQINK